MAEREEAASARILETARLLLIPWSSEFQGDWVRILADPSVVRFISGGVPYSRDEAIENSERSVRLWTEYGLGPWAAVERATGRWVGRIGLNLLADWLGPDRWEVGWELDPKFWGRGYATEGGTEAIRFGFEIATLRGIISVTQADHAASRRVMEKCGLTFREQVRWRNHECVWYAIDRESWSQQRA
jgi:RimJ/RimL family protein N-acetyltransferase